MAGEYTEMPPLSPPAQAVTLNAQPVFYKKDQNKAASGDYAEAPINETHAVTVQVTDPPRFYNTSPAHQEVKNGSICQHCGTSGPAVDPRCYPAHASDTRTHHFVHPDAGKKKDSSQEGAAKDDKEEGQRHFRFIWKLVFVLFLLAIYGVSIAYIVIPIQKYLTQDVASAVTILDASPSKPIPFPGMQICNFNWNAPLSSMHVYYYDPAVGYSVEIDANPVDLYDYGYDLPCYEINNNAANNLMISSKRQAIIVVAEVPTPPGTAVLNDDCPGLCDPTLPDNATIKSIDPTNDALGISIGMFQPTGVNRSSYEGELYVPSGSYSQVYVTLRRTYPYTTPDTAIEAYDVSSSSIPFVPDAYAVNFSGIPRTFKMSEVVFMQVQFGDLAYTEVRESKPYEAFNAFGDATAIVGFFTGFGLFGGPTFHDFVASTAATPFGAKFWYS